jgi:hypothetical protein
MLNGYLRALTLAFVAAASVAALSSAAGGASPKRTFLCGDGQGSVIVTVLSQQSIKVTVDLGGEDGRFTMTMNQQGSGFHFVSGEYDMRIDGSQNSLTYSAPDYGTIGCVWSGH